MMVSITRTLLLATGLSWSLSAAAPTKTILWPATFTGNEYETAKDHYDIDLVPEADWASMTIAQFAAYDAIAIPDTGSCSLADIQFAIDSRTKWSASIGGNIFVVNTSPESNYLEPAATTVVEEGLSYVTDASTTGLYVSLGCYYRDTYPLYDMVTLLDQFGDFYAMSPRQTGPGCTDAAHVMSSAIALNDLSDSDMSNWDPCSVAAIFTDWPSEFNVEAISTDADGPTLTTDTGSQTVASGAPYILARVYTSTGCGNGLYEPNYGEECDASANGDLVCTSDCKCPYGVDDASAGICSPEPVCGNGLIESTELCDNGASNGRLDNSCTTTCQCASTDTQTGDCIVTPNICGNGLYEDLYTSGPSSEQCDAGPDGDTVCNSSCQCIYGVSTTPGECNPAPVCGNSIKETNEQCDDGGSLNGVAGNACGADCQCVLGIDSTTGECLQPNVCGNGYYEPETADDEECDYGYYNGLTDSTCSADCKCIYGVRNSEYGYCKSAPYCGDGELQDGEECEDPLPKRRDLGFSKRYTWSGDETCTAECKCRYGFNTATQACNGIPACGNSVTESTEECDAGLEGDDVCSDACTCIYGLDTDTGLCNPVPDIPETCGDGIFDSETEECDYGITQTGYCSVGCTCIYGVDTTSEVAGTCLSEPTCGNGVVDDDEECDPYSYSVIRREPTNELCSLTCQCLYGYNTTSSDCNPYPSCGNNVLELGEECDAGLNGDDVCSTDCTCIYGLTEEKTCIPAPNQQTTTSSMIFSSTTIVSSTSSSVATTTPVSSSQSSSVSTTVGITDIESTSSPAVTSARFTNSTQTQVAQTQLSQTPVPTPSAPLPSESTSSSTSAGATSTIDPLPATIGIFNFLGCTGSDQNYPSFTLEVSSDEMDLELCTTACEDHVYAGVHTTDCYCADNFDNVTTVAKDLCDTPCPGNPAENCGGFRDVSRLARRQAVVPDNALLAVYVNPALLAAIPTVTPTTSTTVSSTTTVIATNDPALISVTTALTTVVTTQTAIAAAPGSTTTTTVCVGGYCNTGGYIFEICTGVPGVGEIVFVAQPCSCHGGFSYIPANCTGEACLGETVYKCVPVTGSTNSSVVVYEPEACEHCAGGVNFQPVPLTGGESTIVASTTLVTTASDSMSPATATSTLVVVAGASKAAVYLSSMLLVIGALALLL